MPRSKSRARQTRRDLASLQRMSVSLACMAANAMAAGNAAPQTIAHRSKILHDALRTPAHWHHPEITRMGAEKVSAALNANAAAFAAMAPLQSGLAAWMSSQQALAFALGRSLFLPPSPARFWEAQWRYAERSAALTWSMWIRLAGNWMRIAAATAAPIHRVAIANAQRLGKADRARLKLVQ